VNPVKIAVIVHTIAVRRQLGSQVADFAAMVISPIVVMRSVLKMDGSAPVVTLAAARVTLIATMAFGATEPRSAQMIPARKAVIHAQAKVAMRVIINA